MKKLLLVLSLFFTMSFMGDGEKAVYVCDSSTSVAFHATKTCSGLNRCTHEIITVTRVQATDTYGKRACKICC